MMSSKVNEIYDKLSALTGLDRKQLEEEAVSLLAWAVREVKKGAKIGSYTEDQNPPILRTVKTDLLTMMQTH